MQCFYLQLQIALFLFAAISNSFLRYLYLSHMMSRKICQIVSFVVFRTFLIETIAPDFSKRLYTGGVHFLSVNRVGRISSI